MTVSYATSADGTRIAYETHGEGAPVLFVGGALSPRQSALAYVPHLADDWTVVCLDRRGKGDTRESTPWSVEREIEDLAAVIEQLGGAVNVYGHSSGAILSLKAAAAGVPMTTLTTYEPPFLTTREPEGWKDYADRVRAMASGDEPGDAVESFIRHTGAPWDDGIRQSPFWPAMVALAPTLFYDLTIVADAQVPADTLGRITAPVLSLYGGGSPAWAENSARAVAAAVPGAAVDAAPGQTHNADPAVVSPILKDFLRH
ncbi:MULTISPECIES: alpha/beta hydrolase [Arthrobacter]|uniref:Alpha/beta hydrolase n=2 Tax=Arthrobacter TaxID=1663 RepID=A0ABU9KGW6_9MICC|nr:alpha/beta hydrolase [Arthrobacter sp. YJM1]MDP5226131.1 alpha/beta hydrolase [Arthrobacter sp. YJM1]